MGKKVLVEFLSYSISHRLKINIIGHSLLIKISKEKVENFRTIFAILRLVMTSFRGFVFQNFLIFPFFAWGSSIQSGLDVSARKVKNCLDAKFYFRKSNFEKVSEFLNSRTDIKILGLFGYKVDNN